MTNQSTPIIDHVSAKIHLKIFDGSAEFITKIGEELCKEIGITIVKKIDHEFEPIGYTIVFILAESHLAIHTWPEYKLIHVDLISCKPINKDKFDTILSRIISTHNTDNYESRVHSL